MTSTPTPASGPPDDPLARLLRMSHRLPPSELSEAVDEVVSALGVRSSELYLVDHDQVQLRPFGRSASGSGSGSVAIDGTIGGRAFALERTVTVPVEVGVRMWVPLVDGAARVGVMRLDLDEAPADEATTRSFERVASLVAELLVVKDQYTDDIELVRRRRPMMLEAELQRGNIPPAALVTPHVTVAGILLPAYEVAGDSFDYALNSDTLEVAIIDSVGHELASSLVSHLVQGSLRNSRRRGLDLAEAYGVADGAVARIFTDVRFATAAFGHLELGTGRFRWISAGHPPPLLVRAGRVTGETPTVPALPIGLGGTEPAVNEVVLEPGDALLLYTDGVTEGGVRGGERFGLDRLVDLLGRTVLSGLPPAEMLRRLVGAVLAHSAHILRDDTTLLLVERGTAESQGSTT